MTRSEKSSQVSVFGMAMPGADGRALSPSSGRRQGPSVPRCSQADDDPGPPLNANATGRVRLSTPMSVYDT